MLFFGSSNLYCFSIDVYVLDMYASKNAENIKPLRGNEEHFSAVVTLAS